MTVTGTENLLMAAVLADGETVLENAAREPEVTDLANFLIGMGAKIEGAGSSTISSRASNAGRNRVPGVAGSYRDGHLPRRGRNDGWQIRALRTAPDTLEAVLIKLAEAGATIETGDDWIEIDMQGRRPQAIDVRTAPYPAFPDRHAGAVLRHERGCRGRRARLPRPFSKIAFQHVLEMQRMGADIQLEGHTAICTGVDKLTAAPVMATDLRASAGLVLAGLAATAKRWSTAFTTSIAATSASRKSCASWARRYAASLAVA